jgi:DNA-binding response OmpR family regulator
MVILIFEQEQSLRKVLERYLAQLDHEILFAKSYSEALKIFDPQKVNLVVTANGNTGYGLVLIAEIRKITAKIPIILASCNVSKDDIPEGVNFLYKDSSLYIINLIEEIKKIEQAH